MIGWENNFDQLKMSIQLEADAFAKIHPLEFYKKFFSEGVRPDGRKVESNRNILISPETVKDVDGSCMVRIGQSSFLCGIRLEIATNGNGEIIPKVVLPEVASPKFSIRHEMARVQSEITSHINNLIMKKDFIDMKQFDIIIKGEKIGCFVAFVDLYCLEHDGSILDVAILALLGALKNCNWKFSHLVKFPSLVQKDEKWIIDESIKPKSLKINYFPISTTFVILEGYFSFHLI